MAKRPFTTATVIAQKVIAKRGIKSIKKHRRSPKGRLIPVIRLYSSKFRARLKVHSNTKQVEKLRSILIKARKRLADKNVHAITATAWLGEAFQIIAETHHIIEDLTKWASHKYVSKMNDYLKFQKSSIATLNGHFKPVVVNSLFGKPVKINNVRLREPGQLVGNEFFDAGRLSSNSDNQHLPMPTEIKTRGAGGDIRRQKAEFDQRLRDSPVGTVMTYTIEGQSTLQKIDIRNLIMIRDRKNPKRVMDEDAFSRIGVIAGTVPIVKVARDANGRPYIRVKLPVITDDIRRVLERMLKDKSWQ